MPSSIAFYYEPSSFATTLDSCATGGATATDLDTPEGLHTVRSSSSLSSSSVLDSEPSTMPSRGVEEMRREIMLNRATAYLSHVSEKNRYLAPNHDAVLRTTLPPYLTAKFPYTALYSCRRVATQRAVVFQLRGTCTTSVVRSSLVGRYEELGAR
jgi:hypothetical protein